EFATITNIPFQKINAWINGRETLTDSKLKEIAGKFGCEVNVGYEIITKL
ncbi:XRE family transcriptional regulator, partial [Acinetobacter baumannii]